MLVFKDHECSLCFNCMAEYGMEVCVGILQLHPGISPEDGAQTSLPHQCCLRVFSWCHTTKPFRVLKKDVDFVY